MWGGGGAGSGRDVPAVTAVIAEEWCRRFRARRDTTARASRATQEAGGPGPALAVAGSGAGGTLTPIHNFFRPLGYPTGLQVQLLPGLTQPGHGGSAKAPQRRLSRSRHASADTMKTARAGREDHVASLGATKRVTSARFACRQALLLTRGASHSYPPLLLLIRGGVAPPAGSSGFPHIYFAVALGDLSGRARDPETAASVANEVVSSQPPPASARVSAAADA